MNAKQANYTIERMQTLLSDWDCEYLIALKHNEGMTFVADGDEIHSEVRDVLRPVYGDENIHCVEVYNRDVPALWDEILDIGRFVIDVIAEKPGIIPTYEITYFAEQEAKRDER